MRYVRMKPIKQLVRDGLIEIVYLSDDGEFISYKVKGLDGYVFAEWTTGDSKLLVVDNNTVHINKLKLTPDLYEDVE